MAGHSQFKNIMHRKGAQDKARSKLFGKLAREITVSAKLGLPDPDDESRACAPRSSAARAENMPKDNIERAIKKAHGSDAENYDEIRYEGYGPGGVAVIVEALTDNRNRTAGEVRATFTKNGGNLAETGAVSFMFNHVGVVEYDAKVAERRCHAGGRDRGRRRGRGLERETAIEIYHDAGFACTTWPRRWRPNSASRARQRWCGSRRTPIALDDEQRREDAQADRDAQRQRRRAECLRQFRSVGRADAEDERVSVLRPADIPGYIEPGIVVGRVDQAALASTKTSAD